MSGQGLFRAIARRSRTALLCSVMAVTLVACDTAEERAEKHYQNGLALLADGDRQRARVEFLTVFKFNGEHRDARAALAHLLYEDGRLPQSFSQYLRLVEQYPDDIEARTMLAEMGIQMENWDAVPPHVERLEGLAPDAPETKALRNALDYREAIRAEDDEARRAAAERAVALRDALPDNVINQAIIADSLMLDGDYDTALEELDLLQTLAPDDRRFYRMRLSIYAAQKNEDGVAATLRQMVDRFPDDTATAQTLMTFYAARGQLDNAEAFLRDRIVEGEPDDDARVTLVKFVNDVKGLDAAIAEAERFVEEGTNDRLFRSLRATLRFDNGETDASIAEFEDILDTAEPGPETRDVQITLAQVLARTGNEVGARALVEDVLEADPSHVNALRMKADWLIAADQTEEAISLLRLAQDQDPTNPAILKSLAQAHLRNGSRDLAGEMLSLAVESSNRGPAESLDYARFLMADQRFQAAESVLGDALRASPGNVDVLTELGNVYLSVEDWPRAEQVERTLREVGSEAATDRADALRLAMLENQQRGSDAITFLETLAGREGGDQAAERAAEIAIVRTHLRRNDVEAARRYLDSLLEQDPEDPTLRFLDAALAAVAGDLDAAEAKYRALIEAGQGGDRAWLELIRVLNQAGRQDEALAAMDEGLAANPESPELLWMKATVLERNGDFEGALAIYETLYSRNTATSVIANNLASLLSTIRSDEESLDRAWRIARRLRDSDFAPFQDTYGWIAYLRGDYEEAIRHLESAAETLADDALVQAHYGLALAAVDRPADAIDQLSRALDMAGDDGRPAFELARKRIGELRNGDNQDTSTREPAASLPQEGGSGVVGSDDGVD